MKELTFKKFIISKKIEVVCTVKEPHTVVIDSFLRAGIEPQGLPYAFCPKHKVYFGISAEVDMKGMVIKFTDYRGKA